MVFEMIERFAVAGAFALHFSNVFILFLNKIGIVESAIVKKYGLIISLIIALVFTILKTYFIKKEKSNKVTQWLSLNFSKLFLVYILSTTFFFSYETKTVWSQDVFINNIELQWTIFGISITIFLIWNIVIKRIKQLTLQHFGEKPNNLNQKHNWFKAKLKLFQKTSIKFISISLLLVSLLCLSLSTVLFYFVDVNDVSPFIQSITNYSLCLCILSLICLFIEIFAIIINQKDVLFSLSRPSNEDFEQDNKIVSKLANAQIAIKTIKDLNLDASEKDKIIKTIYGELENKKEGGDDNQ